MCTCEWLPATPAPTEAADVGSTSGGGAMTSKYDTAGTTQPKTANLPHYERIKSFVRSKAENEQKKGIGGWRIKRILYLHKQPTNTDTGKVTLLARENHTHCAPSMLVVLQYTQNRNEVFSR